VCEEGCMKEVLVSVVGKGCCCGYYKYVLDV